MKNYMANYAGLKLNPSKEGPLVYCLILNWNSCDETISCIKHLENQDYQNYKILLIDNASSDGSEKNLRKIFPHYEFIQTGKNLGYGGGNNAGIRYAVGKGAEYIWILNPDVEVSKKTLSALIRVMQKNASVGICGPKLFWRGTEKIFWADGAIVNPEEGFLIGINKVAREENISKEFIEVPVVIGCSMLIKSEMLTQTGLIREDFFMFHEETEFNLRVRQYGWKCVVVPGVFDQHHWREKTKIPLARYYFPRNQIFISRLNKKFFWRTMGCVLRKEKFAKLISGKKFKCLWVLVKAIFSGVLTPLGKPPLIGRTGQIK